jgi:WD40 repeat protein
MELSADKKTAVTASESGQVTIVSTKTGEILKQPAPLNLDNIYKLAYQNGNIITAGQDRRVGVYPQNAKPYTIKSNFLVYSVGLSPSGKLGVYSSNEENDLQLFDVESGKKLHTLTGHESIPSTIRFFDENGFFSAGYGNTIYYWYLRDYNRSR